MIEIKLYSITCYTSETICFLKFETPKSVTQGIKNYLMFLTSEAVISVLWQTLDLTGH